MSPRITREVVAAERRLPPLATIVDAPLDRAGGREHVVVAIGLGLRGWSLYRGFRHSVSGPSMLAAHVDLRALLDVTILARWIEDDPELRVRLWFADDQRELLLATRLVHQYLERRGLQVPPSPADWDPAEIDAEIHAARAAGIAAGIPLGRSGRRALPTIEQMAHAVPHLWELYNVAYRQLSPVQHAGGRSFIKDSVEDRKDGRHLKPGAPFSPDALRALAIPAICMLFASVSRQGGLGIEGEADALRMSVVVAPPRGS